MPKPPENDAEELHDEIAGDELRDDVAEENADDDLDDGDLELEIAEGELADDARAAGGQDKLKHQTASYLIRKFRQAGTRPVHRHGQNFLIDGNLLRILADSAELSKNDVILEIGTGTGTLTQQIAPHVAAVVTVEIDAHLLSMAQRELHKLENVIPLQLDALKNKNNFHPAVLETLRKLLEVDPARRLKLVANLPYNIATPVISNLLLVEPAPASMTITIQKEVGDRIVAQPGTKDYGSLSVWIQSQCQASIVRVMPPTVFWPRPKVDSAIVHIVLDPERRALIPDLHFWHTFVRGVFAHRRKFLRSVLVAGYKSLGKSGVDEVLAETGLEPNLRAEMLDMQTLLRLCEALRKRSQKMLPAD